MLLPTVPSVRARNAETGAGGTGRPAGGREEPAAGGYCLSSLVLAGAGGAAFYYFSVLKPKKDAAKGSDDLSDYDFDDYDGRENRGRTAGGTRRRGGS